MGCGLLSDISECFAKIMAKSAIYAMIGVCSLKKYYGTFIDDENVTNIFSDCERDST